MTDVPDGSGQIPRRGPRASDGGAPMSGALAIVLAVIAVVAGFLILRSLSDDDGTMAGGNPVTPDDDAGAGTDDTTTTTTPASTESTTTTTPALQVEGARVIVANASRISGSAGAMTRQLETGPGFDMVEPTNASSTIDALDGSVIYFDTTNPQAEAVAQSLSTVLGGVGTIQPLTGTPPTENGTMGGAHVLLMLGKDKAGKTLAELNPDAVVASPGAEGEGGTAPDPTGDATADDTADATAGAEG